MGSGPQMQGSKFLHEKTKLKFFSRVSSYYPPFMEKKTRTEKKTLAQDTSVVLNISANFTEKKIDLRRHISDLRGYFR